MFLVCRIVETTFSLIRNKSYFLIHIIYFELGWYYSITDPSQGNLIAKLFSWNSIDRPFLIFERALEIYEKSLGPDHAYVAIILSNEANIVRDTGDYESSRKMLGEAEAMIEASIGPDHQLNALVLYNLA